MSEWWTYRPADFLMFSPRTYGRLFELVNEAWWPLHLLVLPAGLLGLLVLAGAQADQPTGAPAAVQARAWAWALSCRQAARRALPWFGLVLGLAWLLCTLVFVQGRYLPVNWAVAYLLPGLWLLVLMLPALAWRAAAGATDAAAAAGAALGARARTAALLLGAWALLLHPLLAPLSGHGWRQAEVLALAPDPTAIATLAWLLVLPVPQSAGWRWGLRLAWLPLLGWCLFSGFMLATMERWQALVPLLAAAVALWARRRAWR